MTHRRHAALPSLALGLALAGAPGTARALSCGGDFWRLPETGASDVPTNALLWGYTRESDRLLGPSGDVVAVDQRVLFAASMAVPVLVPRAELEPSTEYTIARYYFAVSSEPLERITFRTAAGPAATAPEPPRLLASEASVGTAWLDAPGRWQTLLFDGIEERQLGLLGALAPGGGDAAELTSLRDLLRDPLAPPLPALEWLSDRDLLNIGIGGCAHWPEGAPDQRDARFAVFDLAGNVSGWLDVPLELPSEAEALLAAEQERAERQREREEAASRNLQEPRSAIASCSAAVPAATRRTARVAPLALALLLGLIASRRRSAP